MKKRLPSLMRCLFASTVVFVVQVGLEPSAGADVVSDKIFSCFDNVKYTFCDANVYGLPFRNSSTVSSGEPRIDAISLNQE